MVFFKELHDEPYKDKIVKLNKRIIQQTDIKPDESNDETDDNLNDLKHEHTEHLINTFKFVMNHFGFSSFMGSELDAAFT